MRVGVTRSQRYAVLRGLRLSDGMLITTDLLGYLLYSINYAISM